jgi:hypothetical protein
MFHSLRRILPRFITLLLLATLFTQSLSFAAAPPAADPQLPGAAPIPPQIAQASKIFVSNAGGDVAFNAFTDGPNRAYNSFYTDLQHWGRYEIVSTAATADLIFEIRAVAPISDVTGTDGTVNSVASPQLRLRILAPANQVVLWTLTSSVRASGFQKHRDQQFDQSVVNLVNQLRQLVGEPLSPQESADIRSSNRASTAAKVLITLAIAAAIATPIYIIYAITHRSTPTLPATSPCTTPFCPVP